MPSATWWALHAVQDAALTAAMALSFGGSRRVGAHTPYGHMLFLLAVGFWFLLLSEFTYIARQALGLWQGPGALPDALAIPAWLLLVTSVAMFVTRFSTPRSMPIPLLGLTGAAAALILFWGFLSPAGADPVGWVRALYIGLDGVALGVIIGGIDRFRRLRRSALGQLYAFLAAAIVVKSIGDLYWAYLAARDLESIYATATYPIAGAFALIGLARHHRDLRTGALRAPATPWLNEHQVALQQTARHLREEAGEYAARTYLRAAATAFDEAGRACTLAGDTIDARADDAVWQDAEERGRGFALRHFGRAGEKALQRRGGIG